MLKKLVTGKLSLPMTFWGWGFCGGFFLGLIGMAGVHSGHSALVPISYILKTVLFSAVLSGITFILRRKITFLGVIAFLIVLIQVILGVVMVVGLSSLLFK
ncbi:hypothetical protein J8657_17520 [Dickeya oryzae]|uniref:Uncharacterized protein n=1 Tax=Dickeya oryzae TaxID=1240404 RepID=A0ABS5BH84_9GAMM|nr:hypothetical protein [Dickeya oryzae]MBP2859397.1 hypothetical protein [Dickeya oryzae]